MARSAQRRRGPPSMMRRGGEGPDKFSRAASAAMLPNTAIWLSQFGVTDLSGEVDRWASWGGGISCELVAASSLKRPAYSATGGVGGRPLITTDGSNDIMTGAITLGGAHTSNELALTGHRVAFGTLGDYFLGYAQGGADRYAIRDRTATALYFASGNTVVTHASGSADPDANDQRWWATRDQATTTARLGHGTTVDQSITSATIVSYTDGGLVVFGNSILEGAAGNFAVQALDFGALLTEDQRAYLREFITFWTGIAA